jgi:hypothetical protein
MTYSKQIGETLAETLSELFALDDLGIPLNEIRDLKTLQGHMENAKAKYGVKHPKYKALQNLHAKKTASEARKAERMARISGSEELNEIRTLEKLRMQANQAILRHDPIAQEKLQRALSLQQRKRNIVDEDEEQDRAAHREKLRQDYLAKMKPKRDAEAARSAAADEWTRKHIAANAEAAKKKAAEKHATLEKSKTECPTCKRGGRQP